MVVEESEEHVRVIRHDHECIEFIVGVIEVQGPRTEIHDLKAQPALLAGWNAVARVERAPVRSETEEPPPVVPPPVGS